MGYMKRDGVNIKQQKQQKQQKTTIFTVVVLHNEWCNMDRSSRLYQQQPDVVR
jgi:hypothetical protein